MKIMRDDIYWKLAAVCSLTTLVGCIVPGSLIASVIDEPDDLNLHPFAYINITYEDENGTINTDTSLTGKYGVGLVASFQGIGVHIQRNDHNGASDHSGCSWPLNVDPKPKEPWVAVVKRGGCEFGVKVFNAWRANATAVLIYDNVVSTNLDNMKLDIVEDRNISAVMTYKWKGEEIVKIIDSGKRVTIGVSKVNNTSIAQ